jgi:hypothetical protein
MSSQGKPNQSKASQSQAKTKARRRKPRQAKPKQAKASQGKGRDFFLSSITAQAAVPIFLFEFYNISIRFSTSSVWVKISFRRT